MGASTADALVGSDVCSDSDGESLPPLVQASERVEACGAEANTLPQPPLAPSKPFSNSKLRGTWQLGSGMSFWKWLLLLRMCLILATFFLLLSVLWEIYSLVHAFVQSSIKRMATDALADATSKVVWYSLDRWFRAAASKDVLVHTSDVGASQYYRLALEGLQGALEQNGSSLFSLAWVLGNWLL